MAREIEINGPPGETGGSLKLFAVGSDTVAQTIATVTERTNKKGSYLATTTVAPGDYDYRFFGSDSALLSYGTRRILQPDGVYAEPPIADEAVLFETTIKSITQADPPIYELENGPANDDVIIGNPVKIRKGGTTYTIDSATVTDWDVTNMDISLDSAPAFTAAVGDVITVMLGSTVDNDAIAKAVHDYVITGSHPVGSAGELFKWLNSMTEDDGGGNRRWSAKAVEMVQTIGNGFVSGNWNWDTGITAVDPGTNEVAGDNASLASITNLYFNEIDADGTNAAIELSALKVGDGIQLSDNGDTTQFVRGTVSSAPTDNNGWWTVPVTVVDSNGSFSAADSIDIEFQYKVEPPDAVVIAAAVWDRLLSGNHDTAGSAGKIVQDTLTNVGIMQSDVTAILEDTATTLPGLLTTITGDIAALQFTVDNLENLSQEDIRTAIGMATNNMDTQLAAIMAAAPPSAVAVAQAVWDRAVSLHQTPGSAGEKILLASAAGPTKEEIRIEMDTNSAALTNIFNIVDALEDLSAAEAKQEVLDALADLYLDRMFAVACDITADAQTGSLFAQMLEKNASLARFTAAALALAPAGGGGGTTDWTATEREQMRWALGIDGTTSAPVTNSPNLVVANTIPTKEEIRIEIDNNSTSIAAIPTTNLSQADVRSAIGMASANLDTQLSGLDGKLDTISTAVTTTIPTTLSGINPLDAAGTRAALGMASANLDTQLAALGTQLGVGAHQVTLTFENSADNTPLENVQVRLQEGATVVFGITNASGQVTFGLNDATYSVTATKPGFSPITSGTVTTASGVPSPATHQLTMSGITPPAAANLSVGVMYVYDNAGALEGDVWFTVQMTAGPGIPGQSHDTEPRSFQADGAGFLQVTGLVRGATYSIFRGAAGNPNGNPAVPFTVDDVPSFDLPSGVLGFE